MVVTQPAFIYFSGERYLADVDTQKQPWLYRIGAWHRNEIPVAAGSDAPVIAPDPLYGIYAAVTRYAENGAVLSPKEAVTPEQALWMYTMGGAYALFQDDIKGSITQGKLADMVLLSDDPISVLPEEIKNITVEKTVIDGEVVWEK
jgi:predicted amidohydrolase YtcJ